MLKRYHQWVGGVLQVSDALLLSAAWLVSYGLRFYVPLVKVTKGFPSFSTYAALTPLLVFLWIWILHSMGVYSGVRLLRRTHEVQQVLKAHFVALGVFLALTYLFSEYRYSRIVVGYFFILGGIGLVSVRLIVRNSLRAAGRRGAIRERVLIVGDGPSAQAVRSRMERFPELGFQVVGAVSAHTEDLRETLRAHKVGQVVLCLSRQQSAQLDALLVQLKDETVDVQLIPDVFEYITLGCEIEDFDGIPVIKLNDSPLQGWSVALKRGTDVLVAIVALVVLSPLLLLIAVMVKLTSRGPVFFSQERMGIDGRVFGMLKFRTMRVGAESDTGPVWAKPGDDRRTPIGAFLRATSLDELPQFYNVLCGQMSLVGPRPERPVFVDQFKGEIPHYMLRHKVKAGITGWAQVNGWRGNTSLEKRIECDLYYIRNWSYGLDWKILWLTLWKGFINKNAY